MKAIFNFVPRAYLLRERERETGFQLLLPCDGAVKAERIIFRRGSRKLIRPEARSLSSTASDSANQSNCDRRISPRPPARSRSVEIIPVLLSPHCQKPLLLLGLDDPAGFDGLIAGVRSFAAFFLHGLNDDFAHQLLLSEHHRAFIVLGLDGFLEVEFVTVLESVLAAERNYDRVFAGNSQHIGRGAEEGFGGRGLLLAPGGFRQRLAGDFGHNVGKRLDRRPAASKIYRRPNAFTE